MYHLQLIWVGKTRLAFIEQGLQHYQKRMQGMAKLVCTEVAPGKHKEQQQNIWKEHQGIVRHLKPHDYPVLFDERGEALTSVEWARLLTTVQAEQGMRPCFIIGGAYGVHQDLDERLKKKISLSPLTLPYQLARLVVVEQLYRALSLLANMPYHHA